MYQYLGLMEEILHEVDAGNHRIDRTGTGTVALFGTQMRFNLQEGFPLLTTRQLFTKGIVHELLWMLSGSTNVQPLQEQGVRIWNEWATEDGELGPVYGKQWRKWESTDGRVYDQISDVVASLYKTPYSRRHVVSAWNVGDLPQMRLPACHCLFQFFVSSGKLSCQLYQRSADFFLGVPFNIASYALLTHLVAAVVGMEAGEFIWVGGDTHLYLNHVEQAREQLSREPLPLCRLELNTDKVLETLSIFDFTYEDIKFMGYNAHPAIKAKVSV